MPLDDDDIPTAALAASVSVAAGADAEIPTAEEALEEEAQDFRLFATAFRKNTGISAQTIRRGEKDFESHGTRAQEKALEQSRQAMQDHLSYTRVHLPQNWARGWYFPDWWADFTEEEELQQQQLHQKEKRPPAHVRDRVVILETSSNSSSNLGRTVTGQAKDRPGRGKDWLLPEEALFLIERGSLDLWWPMRGMEEMFPPEKQPGAEEEVGKADEQPKATAEADEYEMGFPLSVQAAYALLVGNDGERGKVSLQKFQMYSNLKRAGFNLLRAPSPPPSTQQAMALQKPPQSNTIWQWLVSLLTGANHSPQPYGPLVKPGLHRSYNTIYQQMAVIPRHKPSEQPSCAEQPQAPFEIHYHVWKAAAKWTKLRHPPPDFYISVVDAQQTDVPSYEEITALIDATPYAPSNPDWAGQHGRLYARLKHGHRNVLIAVVDHGVINYMRFAEGAFGEEPLFPRFDTRGATRGGKRGGGRNHRGKSGRGGRGGRGR
ncbi:putative tRNA-splicing endonuclease subunit tsp-5 [Diplogelasinospora grovesii]|uniref:tRNA-splicing endonuclease subunit tsp-5 n=1 Tax=Diplogelasinospora grovesii TaxID=303347 RepID=A0AAN6NMI8_9PEZI|nr:putative tRNA-splicing endonuclease subunit tsp-5 [Diplogelasinospora grovesii]